ncbi:hypothetical protein ACFQ9H_19335 [Streptomyces sp. NPDC056517]|uniref:hypothetical protein n=1 Tax=Streptomyces sp. NPDC056517 TaxID=3345848 RepID=UPI0036D0AF2D
MIALSPYLAALLLAAAVAVTWAARLWPARPTPAAARTEPEAVVWLACHTTRCAHLTTRHDETPDGLVCRSCGTVNGGAAA